MSPAGTAEPPRSGHSFRPCGTFPRFSPDVPALKCWAIVANIPTLHSWDLLHSHSEPAHASPDLAGRGKRRTAYEKRRAAHGKRRAACGKRRAACGKRRAAHGKRRAACGKRRAACGKRRAAYGKRRAACGKRRPARGNRRAGGGTDGVAREQGLAWSPIYGVTMGKAQGRR